MKNSEQHNQWQRYASGLRQTVRLCRNYQLFALTFGMLSLGGRTSEAIWKSDPGVIRVKKDEFYVTDPENGMVKAGDDLTVEVVPSKIFDCDGCYDDEGELLLDDDDEPIYAQDEFTYEWGGDVQGSNPTGDSCSVDTAIAGNKSVTLKIIDEGIMGDDSDQDADLTKSIGGLKAVSVSLDTFSNGYGQIRGPSCQETDHQHTCGVTVVPNDVELTYDVISSSNYGVTVDSDGVVTDGDGNDSGWVTVKVWATECPSAYDTKPFLLKARPDVIQNTSIYSGLPPGAYGCEFRHDFITTGLNLDHITITEAVTVGQNDFEPDLKNGDYEEEIGDRTCGLDTDGWMTGTDTVSTSGADIKIGDVADLPKKFITDQVLYWKCPKCGKYNEFTSTSHVVTLWEGSPAGETWDYTVTTEIEGESVDQEYGGPPP